MTLKDYLDIPNADGTRKRKRVFAAAIGVTPTMVTEYAENRMWPRREIMEAIVRETGGLVTPNDFLQIEAAAT
jgi:hypothetical protein